MKKWLELKFSLYLYITSISFHRRGHDDLGDHYLDCGDLSNALKCYSRARDYCTSPKHVVNMCLNVIKVGQPFRPFLLAIFFFLFLISGKLHFFATRGLHFSLYHNLTSSLPKQSSFLSCWPFHCFFLQWVWNVLHSIFFDAHK